MVGIQYLKCIERIFGLFFDWISMDILNVPRSFNSVLIRNISTDKHLFDTAIERKLTSFKFDINVEGVNWLASFMHKVPLSFIIGIENNDKVHEIIKMFEGVGYDSRRIFRFDPDFIDHVGLICKLCDAKRTLSSKYELKEHLTRAKHIKSMKFNMLNAEIGNIPDEVKCDICGPDALFKNKKSYKNHLKSKRHQDSVRRKAENKQDIKITESMSYDEKVRAHLLNLDFEIVSCDPNTKIVTVRCKKGHDTNFDFWCAMDRKTNACSTCRRDKHLNIADICKEQGFELVNDYKYGDEKVNVKCLKCGLVTNKWRYSLIKGYGCPKCQHDILAFGRRKNIDDARELANMLGFTLLSDEYKLSRTKLKLLCSKGHECNISYNKLQQRRGCKQCSINNARTSIEDAIQAAIDNNFINISFVGEYKGNSTFAYVECKNGHRTLKSVSGIRQGNKCILCYYDSKKKTIEEAREMGLKMGFKLISDKYERSINPMLWECIAEGHIINTSYNNIKQSFGCWKCKCSRGERLIRYILNEMKISNDEQVRRLITEHPSYRFDFVLYYNEKWVFIEYDGIQHFCPEMLHKSDQDFLKARERDRFKQNTIINYGHRMIRIDYTIKDRHVKDHIIKGLQSDKNIYYSTPELYDWM